VSATMMNDIAELDAAISDMRESRKTHDEWLGHIRSGCACCTPETLALVGDADHHLECVAKYDRVLSILTARRNALRSHVRRSVGAALAAGDVPTRPVPPIRDFSREHPCPTCGGYPGHNVADHAKCRLAPWVGAATVEEDA
jgi:hypothetical protein